MVKYGKVERLLKQGKIRRISELELERYLTFFENSYRDDLEHCKANLKTFPRWAIISGYYAMHDITKLLLAKKFRIKVDFQVHATTIAVLREVVKNRDISGLMERGYREFLSLASDLDEARRERVKVQYYTGTEFLRREYLKRAQEFYDSVVLEYLERLGGLVK